MKIEIYISEEKDGVRLALEELIKAAESYMEYHGAKFYAGLSFTPTGLWPAINKAKKALAK